MDKQVNLYSGLSDQPAKLLAEGKVGVIPTDTVYGLAANAHHQAAVSRALKLKGREQNPGTIIAANIDQLASLGIKRRYLTAVEHLWPNPLSIVIPAGEELANLHLGRRSLAVRIPKAKTLREFLVNSGPLMTTSANRRGETPATNVKEAQKYFGEEADFYVEGGSLKDAKPSTIIRIVDDAIEVLREGAVTIDENGRIK